MNVYSLIHSQLHFDKESLFCTLVICYVHHFFIGDFLVICECLFTYHESCCSSWSCICFSSSVGVVVLTVTVKFLGLGGGGGGALNSEISITAEGGGGGVSCFYSFGEPLKTWTYAMLTCIVYHVILLYS